MIFTKSVSCVLATIGAKVKTVASQFLSSKDLLTYLGSTVHCSDLFWSSWAMTNGCQNDVHTFTMKYQPVPSQTPTNRTFECIHGANVASLLCERLLSTKCAAHRSMKISQCRPRRSLHPEDTWVARWKTNSPKTMAPVAAKHFQTHLMASKVLLLLTMLEGQHNGVIPILHIVNQIDSSHHC